MTLHPLPSRALHSKLRLYVKRLPCHSILRPSVAPRRSQLFDPRSPPRRAASSSASRPASATTSTSPDSPRASSTKSTNGADSATLRYPASPTTAHHDLPSYLNYAARMGLDRRTTIYVGTHYEYTVALSLRRLGFDVQRVGGRDDAGIDLLGTWDVPTMATTNNTSPATEEGGETTEPESANGVAALPRTAVLRVRVILQCKASAGQQSRIGPAQIRELEGAFVGAPVGWRRRGSSSASSNPDGVAAAAAAPIVGFLVAQKPATKGVRDALGRSRWPMGFVSCSQNGRIEQMIWNRRAEEEGLDGIGAAIQFCSSEDEVLQGQHHDDLLRSDDADVVVIDEGKTADDHDVAKPFEAGASSSSSNSSKEMIKQVVLTWNGKPYDSREIPCSSS